MLPSLASTLTSLSPMSTLKTSRPFACSRSTSPTGPVAADCAAAIAASIVIRACGGRSFPSSRAALAGDGDLLVPVAEQRQDAAVALPVQIQRLEIVAQTGAAFAGQGEDREVRGAVDVELGGDGAFQRADRKSRFVRGGARP